VRDAGGEVAISELTPTLRTNFKTLGLDQILPTFPSDAAAVQYLREVHGAGERSPGAAVVHFHLPGAPDHTAAGLVRAVYEEGLTFTYPADPDKVRIDPDDLQIGRVVRIRLRQPVTGPARFLETQAEIVMAMGLDDGTTKYRLRCTSTNGADRERWATLVREWQRAEP